MTANQRKIIDCICAEHGTTYGQMIGAGRTSEILNARFAVAYYFRMHPRNPASWPEVSRIIGRKSHGNIKASVCRWAFQNNMAVPA